jgi:hypothetical protein
MTMNLHPACKIRKPFYPSEFGPGWKVDHTCLDCWPTSSFYGSKAELLTDARRFGYRVDADGYLALSEGTR